MSAALGVTLDGVDLATLGFAPTGAPHVAMGAAFDWPSERPIGSPARVPLTARPVPGSVPLVLRGVVRGSTRQEMIERLDAIGSRAAGGEVEIAVTGARTVPGSWFGWLSAIETGEISPTGTQPAALHFRLADPWRYGGAETVAGIGTAGKDIPLGTATASNRDHAWTLAGGSGAATMVVSDSSGTEVARIELGSGLPVGTVTLDHEAGTIMVGTTDVIEHLTPRSVFPLAWDIGWADVPASSWPSVTASRGALSVTRRRAYLR